MTWAARYLIKQAVDATGGSALSAQIEQPFTRPAAVRKIRTLADIRTAQELMRELPPSPKRVPLRRVLARLGVNQ